MSSNLVFQATVVLLFLAHLGALIGRLLGPRTIMIIIALNAVIAVSALVYAANRARFNLVTADARESAFILIEVLILASAIWAFRDNRAAIISSYVAFGLHFLVTLAAVIFTFAFKMTRLF